MKTIGRLITAMVTPFDAQGEVDYGQAKRLAQALVDSGTEGLVVTGTTGESPTLSNDEKLRMYATVVEAVGDRAAVIAGTTTYNTAESVHLTKEADHLGVDGFLLTVPYYNNPPQEGLYQHFKAIAVATDKPCILYNVPSRTVRNMEAATTIRLSQIENLTGVKEASANFDQITKIIQGARPGFRVWSGNDSDTLPILAMGGYGIVSVVAHLTGLQVRSMIDKFLAGDNAGAAAIHRHLLPLVNALFLVANPIPVKFMLNQIGFNVGQPRLPLVAPDDKTAAQIKETLAGYKIDLPVPAYR
ncbi:MAG: 4-hydroxy-tetrahydrodipicolinate synthase [Chloroflexi bacterium]|nr:4-hydroxy-tetrahydrodipicolinate synthase [Chloroflexota bacterium]